MCHYPSFFCSLCDQVLLLFRVCRFGCRIFCGDESVFDLCELSVLLSIVRNAYSLVVLNGNIG